MSSHPTAPRVRRTLVVAALLTTVLGGCGAGSVVVGTEGVDTLTIPTPSPEAADFDDVVDNPRLPLLPGSRWNYDVTDASGSHRLRVAVAAQPRSVDGVSTTVVVSRERGGTTRDFYAQDLDGNVWWFGRGSTPGTSWQAGTRGAEAGIAMLATPRVGDGYRRGYAPGVVDDVVQVDSITGSETVPAGTYDDLVAIGERSELDSGRSTDRSYAAGVGLVLETGVGVDYRSLRLLSADLPLRSR